MSRCVHSFEVDPSTHELQCVLCGFVEPRVALDEQPSEARGERSGQFIHALAAVQSGAQLDASLSARRLNELGARSVGSDRLRKRVEAVVLRCVPLLQLRAHQTQQTTAMMHDLIHRKLWCGRYAERVVAACAYTVLRRDGEPRTLRDVASTLDLHERDVVRAYRRIVGLLGFEMPIVDAAAFAERAVAKLELTLPEQRALVDVTTRILTLCQTTALWGTGRRPEALVAAALSVAVDALKLTERINLENVRSACDAVPSTLKERRSELHKQVLAWADAYSTWLPRPVRHYSAVVPSLLTLIKQTEMLTELSTQDDTAGITKLFDDDDDDEDNDDDDDGCADNADGNAAVADPPAYVNAVQKSDRRMALIVGTKLRMIESGNKLDFTDIEAPYLADGAKARLVNVHGPLSAQDERDANTIRLLVLSGVGVRDMLTVNDLTRLLPARQTASEQGIDLDSTQITGADMHDAELSTYVLSDAERQVKRARVAADVSAVPAPPTAADAAADQR
jgi:transcription initiation factor TFIIIB Brf1 subunit/transcription initiation factor TFIIB